MERNGQQYIDDMKKKREKAKTKKNPMKIFNSKKSKKPSTTKKVSKKQMKSSNIQMTSSGY